VSHKNENGVELMKMKYSLLRQTLSLLMVCLSLGQANAASPLLESKDSPTVEFGHFQEGSLDQVGSEGSKVWTSYTYYGDVAEHQNGSTGVWYAMPPNLVLPDSCAEGAPECLRLTNDRTVFADMDQILKLDGTDNLAVDINQQLGKQLVFCVTPQNANSILGHPVCTATEGTLAMAGNQEQPVASVLEWSLIPADLHTGELLKARYTFTDPQGDEEKGSYLAFESVEADGTTHALSHVTDSRGGTEYELNLDEIRGEQLVDVEGLTLRFCVLPKTSYGSDPDDIGVRECSEATPDVVGVRPGDNAPTHTVTINDLDGNVPTALVIGHQYYGHATNYADTEFDARAPEPSNQSYRWLNDADLPVASSTSEVEILAGWGGDKLKFCATPYAKTGEKIGAEVCTALLEVMAAQ
jgi:hypothetical protein